MIQVSLLLISTIVSYILVPLTHQEKKRAMIKWTSVITSVLFVSLVIFAFEAYYPNSFLLLLLLILVQEFFHGIVFPMFFIFNLPNLKNYISDLFNYDWNPIKMPYKTLCKWVPHRDNQIDVMA